MAKIRDTIGRSDANSGYSRLLGSQQLGHLISRLHATVIRTGNELESVLRSETPEQFKSTLDRVLRNSSLWTSDVQIVFQAHKPESSGNKGSTVDIVIFLHIEKRILLIELKDGDTFDTKKASGELQSLRDFAAWISTKIAYSVDYYICSFNQSNKDLITKGSKDRFDVEHVMTGNELCTLLGINYDTVRRERQAEQIENLQYFLSELVRIPEVRESIQELLDKKI